MAKMKRCDICQGNGEITVIKRITRVIGYSVNTNGPGVDFEADSTKEKCPKCDGKGMVSE